MLKTLEPFHADQDLGIHTFCWILSGINLAMSRSFALLQLGNVTGTQRLLLEGDRQGAVDSPNAALEIEHKNMWPSTRKQRAPLMAALTSAFGCVWS